MSVKGWKLTSSSTVQTNQSKQDHSIEESNGYYDDSYTKLNSTTVMAKRAINNMNSLKDLSKKQLIRINLNSNYNTHSNTNTKDCKVKANRSSFALHSDDRGRNKHSIDSSSIISTSPNVKRINIKRNVKQQNTNKAKRNNSIEITRHLKTISTDLNLDHSHNQSQSQIQSHKERVLEMKREKDRIRQELYESTQKKKQQRTHIIKGSREKASKVHIPHLQTESAIQVNKRKDYMTNKFNNNHHHRNKISESIATNSNSNGIRNHKELVAQKDKIKEMLLKKIQYEAQLKEQFKKKVSEYNAKIMVNRVNTAND